ncbi:MULTISPECIES: CPBP family intramembrane glutamic endopeptidase [unclassified Geodermatophilus]
MTTSEMPAGIGTEPAVGGPLRRFARRRPVTSFLVGALGTGWTALGTALVAGLPVEPFLLAATVVGLLGPAVAVTWLADGRPGVRRLFAGVLRWRIGWTWALLVLLGIPGTTLGLAAVTGTLVWPGAGWGRFAADLAVSTLLWGTLLLNLWEETAWAGFVQRRLVDRHGLWAGSALTALPFAALHLPLLFDGRPGVGEVVLGAGGLLVVALVFRLLAGCVLLSTGGSILAVGVLHAAFNTAGDLDAVEGGWQRDVALLLCTAAVLAVRRLRSRDGAASVRPAREGTDRDR